MTARKQDDPITVPLLSEDEYTAARQRAQESKPEGVDAALEFIRQARQKPVTEPRGVPRRGAPGPGSDLTAHNIDAAISEYVDQLNMGAGDVVLLVRAPI